MSPPPPPRVVFLCGTKFWSFSFPLGFLYFYITCLQRRRKEERWRMNYNNLHNYSIIWRGIRCLNNFLKIVYSLRKTVF